MSESTQTVEREVKTTKKEITFLDYHAPPLADGTYKIDAVQEVYKKEEKLDGPYESEYEFVVSGVQFSLPGDTIESVYPPAGSTGLYDGHLPHVVLKDTSLPWQRNPGGASVEDAGSTTLPSWLALFLFDGTEGIPETKQGHVSDLKKENRPSGIFYPYDEIQQGPNFEETTPCSYIDVNADFFNRIAPSTDDLPYLAHVRETDAAQQALDHREARTGMMPLQPSLGSNGTSSSPPPGQKDPSTKESAIVVGTRLPKAALKRESGQSVPTQNTVHLISLEGYGNYLPEANGSSNLPSGTNGVRLVSMHHWTFNASKHEYPLWKILHTQKSDAPTHTVKNPKTGKMETKREPVYTDTRPPFLHLPSNDLADSLSSDAKDAVRAGFTPMMYHMRTGDEVAAWYRGPLSPLPVKDEGSKSPYDHADQLLHLDDKTGMFDVSYAAAYQLGRLLTLHDGHAAEAIARWRNAKLRRSRQALTRRRLLQSHPPHPEASPSDGVDAAQFQSAVTDALAETLSDFLDTLDADSPPSP